VGVEALANGSNGTGMLSSGGAVGISATATGGTGIGGYFQGVTGVSAVSASPSGAAVYGSNSATSGGHGIVGVSNADSGFGVIGQNNSAGASAIGVLGYSPNSVNSRGGFFLGRAIGVKGEALSATGVGVEASDGGIPGAYALYLV
jgi:hypothetical protein